MVIIHKALEKAAFVGGALVSAAGRSIEEMQELAKEISAALT